MDVAVEGHGGADFVVALHATDGNGHVVDHAESLTVIRKSVMESSAEADADFVSEALAGREDGAAGGEPERFCEVARVGDFHFHFFARAERACFELVDVFGFVNEKYVLIGGGLRFEEIGGVGHSSGDETVTNATVLFGGKDVIADGEVVGVAVDEFEGEHGARCCGTSHNTR